MSYVADPLGYTSMRRPGTVGRSLADCSRWPGRCLTVAASEEPMETGTTGKLRAIGGYCQDRSGHGGKSRAVSY